MGSSNSKTGPFKLGVVDQVSLGNGAANAAQLPDAAGHTVLVRAICPGQTIYIGRFVDLANVTTTAKTYPLSDQQSLAFEVKNANELCAFASAAGCRLAYLVGTYY